MSKSRDLWYKNAIVYAVDIKSFQDSDGDGIGDFRGMIQRLPYLSRLGITGLWLLPFYPSPLRDNGYDISDYYNVDPRLGTLEEFIDLVHRAGELGIRVITDLPMNHTSNEHPWFQAARRSADSRYRHYYIWSDSPPSVRPGGEDAFPGTETSAWSYDEVARAYYYHLFYAFQPDLNSANPDVIEEMRRFIQLWTSFGVSGFRLDAIGPMVDKRARYGVRKEDPFLLLTRLRKAMHERELDGVLLGEADVPPDQLVHYFGRSGRLNMLLNFLMSQYLFLALAKHSSEPLAHVLRLLPPAPDDGQWVNFLRNLDELNLDKLSPEERAFTLQAFGPDPQMQLYNRGIRRRVATMLDGDLRRMRLAYSLLFSMHGAPLITYGDEIGMGDDLSLFERESVRTPMQWGEESNAGFSSVPRAKLLRPVIAEGPFGFSRVNVEAQLRDPGSMLNWMQKLILARRQCVELGYDSGQVIETGDESIFIRRYDWQGRTLLTIHNLSGSFRSLEFSARDLAWLDEPSLLGDIVVEKRGASWRLQLEPYSFGWFRTTQPTPVSAPTDAQTASARSPSRNGRVAVAKAETVEATTLSGRSSAKRRRSGK